MQNTDRHSIIFKDREQADTATPTAQAVIWAVVPLVTLVHPLFVQTVVASVWAET